MVENIKFKKGFSLLELIVGIAIVAILVGLSILGISVVQRSSRDAERRATLEAINLEIISYYGVNQSYPATGTISVTTTTATVGTNGKTVNLKGAAAHNATLTPPIGATSGGTRYCYVGGSTYSVGVALESTQWYNLGNATTPCGGGLNTNML